eukprot:11012345-Prorocentrum_lima.AAC.1
MAHGGPQRVGRSSTRPSSVRSSVFGRACRAHACPCTSEPVCEYGFMATISRSSVQARQFWR